MTGLLMKTFKRVRPRTTPSPSHRIKVIIVAGFLGAGKTTFITKLLKEINDPKHTLIIENDFGQISFDAEHLREIGIRVNSLVSGCICCSMIEDFEKELLRALKNKDLSYLIIEPSGVSKLSEIIKICSKADIKPHIDMVSVCTIVDASKANLYAQNFGNFFHDQIRYAQQIFISHVNPEDPLTHTLEDIQKANVIAPIYILNWEDVSLLDYITQHPREEIAKIVGHHKSILDDSMYHIMDCTQKRLVPLHQYKENPKVKEYEEQLKKNILAAKEQEEKGLSSMSETSLKLTSSPQTESDILDCESSLAQFHSFCLDYTEILTAEEWKKVIQECLDRDINHKVLRIKGVLPTPNNHYEVQYNGNFITMKCTSLKVMPLTIIADVADHNEFYSIFKHKSIIPITEKMKDYS